MLLLGNNIELLKTLEDNSIDSLVTDPPYGLKFMNKKWDHSVPSVEFWREVLRVLKPGGHVLSFGGTRTYHRMAINIEDAGFEIRDQIMWLYGSGFPKSHNISKAIDKKLGVDRDNDFKSTTVRETANSKSHRGTHLCNNCGKFYGSASANCQCPKSKPATDLAKQWDGFGTALKPANEPIVLARKPLSEKTIVANVLKWGTGGLNIDGCRISGSIPVVPQPDFKTSKGITSMGLDASARIDQFSRAEGRFPANVILDEEAGKVLDAQSGILKQGVARNSLRKNNYDSTSYSITGRTADISYPDTNSGASRFFYCPKASKKERNAGLEGMEAKYNDFQRESSGLSQGKDPITGERSGKRLQPNQNHHPTVKPIKLMEYLIKLVTPPNGRVLDPFMGSGSTGVAAKNLGFEFTGMELSEEYFEIAKRRIK